MQPSPGCREVRGGERVQWLQRAAAAPPPAWQQGPAVQGLPRLQVLYEDDHIACIVKPQVLRPGVDHGLGRGCSAAATAWLLLAWERRP